MAQSAVSENISQVNLNNFSAAQWDIMKQMIHFERRV